MVDNAWFRLLIRGIGVFLLVETVPSVVSTIGLAVSAYMNSRQFSAGVGFYSFGYFAGPFLGLLLQGGLGIYLLFFAEGLIRRCLSDTIGRCPMCQYDLKGQRTGICPECGCSLAPIPATPPTQAAADSIANSNP